MKNTSIPVLSFKLFSTTLRGKLLSQKIAGYIINQDIAEECIAETLAELSATYGDKCKHCEGTGIVLVANGSDDYDKEVCECKMK